MSDARVGRPPMSRDEADRTLARLRDERDRISTALLELEAHHGYQLLEGAALDGETRRVQADVRTGMASLWGLFDLYGSVVSAAEDLRARNPRPGQAQLTELTRLLAGPSVELPVTEVPLGRRTLLSVPSGERLTLRAAVERMTPLYEEVAQAVASLDAVWSALLSRLAEVEAERRAADELLESLGGTEPELDRLRADLDAVAAVVRADPMALAAGGSADTGRLDAIHAGLAEVRRGLEQAERVRDGFTGRLRAVAGVLDRLREEEAEARRVRDEVLTKIASPAPPDLPGASASLADRLAALGRPGHGTGWNELAARVEELERAADDALARARETVGLIRGLLDRRAELRGRLEAYRVKAARLGHAEDAGLARIHDRARELLWTSPCDLRRATVALSEYQRAVNARSKGAKR
ncbi:hypothetical protein [Actinomadura livida]|uniref:Uncharacterized protein n=1 Tax=Actinomadura livida TaxID=79909 RepID=A0A7W7IH19_9ACTN|nr:MULTISPECIES: hypothetical protein [Actinomadura]MBB4776850.1 hypothetical protein [Actinomadura catellatispora]GGT95334.1 hypothetical protein GCM10010208_18220 [Actinomadura livida]